MAKWKAPMPKTDPKPGHAHVVLAFKNSDKLRAEYVGQLPDELVGRLFIEACRKKQPAGQDEGIAAAMSAPNKGESK